MYWYWLICGVLMILMEFGIPGFVICFFGVSALITGGLSYFFPELALAWQLLIFSAGGAALALLCRWLVPGIFKGGKRQNADKDVDDDDVCGSECVCREKIMPGEPGKVEFRGTLWNASADEEIAPGIRCKVIRRDNLMLQVKSL
jgi:membrane protein implicated in regulation of membrane protease activity